MCVFVCMCVCVCMYVYPHIHVQVYESEIAQLEQQLTALQEAKDDMDEVSQSKISRLCVISLPHAVAKLHDLIYREVSV